MIRCVNSNFVCDYAVWRYPNLFTTKKHFDGIFSVSFDFTCAGYYSVKCSLCRMFHFFKSCKEVDAHVKVHVDEGNDKYCGH